MTYKCEVCKDTGYYGDNGAGIRGNREYQPCDMPIHKGNLMIQEQQDLERARKYVDAEIRKRIETKTVEFNSGGFNEAHATAIAERAEVIRLRRELEQLKNDSPFISMENQIMAYLRERQIQLHGEKSSLTLLIDYAERLRRENRELKARMVELKALDFDGVIETREENEKLREENEVLREEIQGIKEENLTENEERKRLGMMI